MRFRLVFASILVLLSCNSKPRITQFSVVGSKDITQEITGASYVKKAKSYFIITDGDTSNIKFEFSEAINNETCSVYFADDKENSTVTYRQKIKELKTILPEAAKDFKIDSLNAIFIRTLLKNGDIATYVTEEYMKLGIDKLEYPGLKLFMKNSKLSRDMNELFVGYGVKIKEFHLEKCHYSSKADLLMNSVIERDTATIPNRIIDCSTWIVFESLQK